MSDYDAEQFHQDVEGRLRTLPFFDDITFKRDEPGVIIADIETALGTLNEKNGKMGALVMIMVPEEKVPNPDTSGPQLMLSLKICVFTNALFNMDEASGTKKSNMKIRTQVRKALHHWSPNGSNTITCDPDCGTPFDTKKGIESYELNFNMECPQEIDSPVARPTIVLSGSLPEVSATLSHHDPSAEIRYTLDGSFPGLESDLYTIPHLIESACTIRAAAYIAGRTGSDAVLEKIS